MSDNDVTEKNDKTLVTGYRSMFGALDKVEAAAAGLRGTIKSQLEIIENLAEARKREAEGFDYEQKKERQRLADETLAETVKRESAFAEREARLAFYTKAISGVLGVPPLDNELETAAALKAAYESALDKARKEGTAAGAAAATTASASASRLAEVANEGKIKLYEQELAALRKRAAELEAQNTALLARQGEMLAQMKDISVSALNASAGIQSKATDSLAQAASNVGVARPTR